MAGLYIHIPFCRQACSYCNFHFSTRLQYQREMIPLIARELVLQKDYLQGATLQTIYLGGGTPSLLSAEELRLLFDTIIRHYPVASDAEITLEANPDDLDAAGIRKLRTVPINRLSIGTQSFREEDLRWMNRVHTAAQAIGSVKRAQDAGLENLSIDLIYGIPNCSDADWKRNVQQAAALRIQHLSCYALTVEPRTKLAFDIAQRSVQAPEEERAAAQLELLMDLAPSLGYRQYEISNFAQEGFHSRHNSAYWSGEHYLGAGPGAHSFNGESRQWNLPNNQEYMQEMRADHLLMQQEVLTPVQRFNEYMMTSLRTARGADLAFMESSFGPALFAVFQLQLEKTFHSQWMERQEGRLRLTPAGRLIADKIILDLFLPEQQ